MLYKANGEQTRITADGVISTLLQPPDPRFGMQAPLIGNMSVKMPSGLTSTLMATRIAERSDANDLLSLVSLTDTSVINGNTYTRTFDRAALTSTETSPMSRTSTIQLDGKGRPLQATIANLSPLSYSYDDRGRLTAISQGSDQDSRISLISYNAQGYADTLTDALDRTIRLEYDLSGHSDSATTRTAT